ncbi:valine--pyruvate transaminase [Candidatus Saccharibacteria bacterium]|nr:MAG: valine--pyruvate transaminase [Candidatus Saccharibacteria bacterium]
MKLSDFGERIAGDAGILRLMDDLGRALSGGKPTAMFGGGNPAHIPAVTHTYERQLRAIATDPVQLQAMLGNYDTPQGNDRFIRAIVQLLNDQFDWGITPDHVAVTPGSQSGFFMLFNLLAGTRHGIKRRIMLPIVPEYIGYADQLIEPACFMPIRPTIRKVGQHEFKYRLAAQSLSIDDSVAAIAFSRPTNPTGNAMTDEEVSRLAAMARQAGVPLIIDSAYGLPFPGVIHDAATPYYDDNTVISLSLSKIGLPSARVGIFVGPPPLMKALSSANAIVNLASPSIGQYIARELVASSDIMELATQHVQPFYAERAAHARQLFMDSLPPDLPWRFHIYEGSYFFWLWCDGAAKTATQLYDYLKKRGVIVVPGEFFFPGIDVSTWPHAQQCIRINFSRPDAELTAGARILADGVRWMYGNK